jgi:hypothetical protein
MTEKKRRLMAVILLDDKIDPRQLGELPLMLDDDDPRSAREQLHANYAHGGGWQPFDGFTVLEDLRIKYPGDPALSPRAVMRLRQDALVLMYDHDWVMIVDRTGAQPTFEIARMD